MQHATSFLFSLSVPLAYHFLRLTLSTKSVAKALKFGNWFEAGGAAKTLFNLFNRDTPFGPLPQKVYIWHNAKSSVFAIRLLGFSGTL